MYRLRWLESVTRDLLQATATVNPDVRDRIFRAMADAELLLESDADIAGESRDKGRRLLIVAPLSITYEINAKDRIVTILQVRVHSTKD
jgi:hypothetical protein